MSTVRSRERAGAVVTDGERDDVLRKRLTPDDTIVPERQDAEGHDLLREMRMCPLVRIALREKLEGGARVIDLVEVHVARVIEPVAAREQQREGDEQRDAEIAPRRRMTSGERLRQAPRGARLSGGAARPLLGRLRTSSSGAPRRGGAATR